MSTSRMTRPESAQGLPARVWASTRLRERKVGGNGIIGPATIIGGEISSTGPNTASASWVLPRLGQRCVQATAPFRSDRPMVKHSMVRLRPVEKENSPPVRQFRPVATTLPCPGSYVPVVRVVYCTLRSRVVQLSNRHCLPRYTGVCLPTYLGRYLGSAWYTVQYYEDALLLCGPPRCS